MVERVRECDTDAFLLLLGRIVFRLEYILFMKPKTGTRWYPTLEVTLVEFVRTLVSYKALSRSI